MFKKFVSKLLVLFTAVVMLFNTTGCGSDGSNAVLPQILVALGITPPIASIAAGFTQQFTATAIYQNGTQEDVTDQVVWSSADNNTATVNAAGLATGVAANVALINIIASFEGLSTNTLLGVTAALLQSFTIDQTDFSLAHGRTSQLTATGQFSDGSARDITNDLSWMSSAGGTVSVGNVAASNKGLATAEASSGTATITATHTATALMDTIDITGAAALVNSISITPDPVAEIAKGRTQQLMAMEHLSDGTSNDITERVSWSVTAAAPGGSATVGDTPATDKGLVTAVLEGTATVEADDTATSGLTDSVDVVIGSKVAESVTVTPAPPADIILGTTLQLTAMLNFSDGTSSNITSTATWTPVADPVAPVSNGPVPPAGLVTGLTVGGPIAITALDVPSGLSDTVDVMVTNPVVGVKIMPEPIPDMPKGTTTQLSAFELLADGSTGADITERVTWTSNNGNGTVGDTPATDKGLVTGALVGTSTITADDTATSGFTADSDVEVIAAAVATLAITPSPVSDIPAGTSTPLTATAAMTDLSIVVLTDVVAWSSAADATATVDNTLGGDIAKGTVTGVSVGGPVTITATAVGLGAGGVDVSAMVDVTVIAPTVVGIKITPSPVPDVETDDGVTVVPPTQLSAFELLSDGTLGADITERVTWSITSSAPAAAATVGDTPATDKGEVVGLLAGSVTVEADDTATSGFTDTTDIIIVNNRS